MTMPDVHADELLYRQIGPRGNPIYFDPARTPPVHQSRFLPANNDTDGLSFIRSRLRTEIWSAFRLENPEVRFRLAIVKSSRMQLLPSDSGFQGLSFRSTADSLDARFGAPWAHCVVPEINRASYDNDLEAKRRIKDWAMGMANLVSNRDVIGPFQEPTDADRYRPNDMQV